MKEALEKKDLDLAAAQKEGREKTTLADKKLASVGKLEEENSKLKTAISDANREVEKLRRTRRTCPMKSEASKPRRASWSPIWDNLLQN